MVSRKPLRHSQCIAIRPCRPLEASFSFDGLVERFKLISIALVLCQKTHRKGVLKGGATGSLDSRRRSWPWLASRTFRSLVGRPLFFFLKQLSSLTSCSLFSLFH